jgi:hypothetical protein
MPRINYKTIHLGAARYLSVNKSILSKPDEDLVGYALWHFYPGVGILESNIDKIKDSRIVRVTVEQEKPNGKIVEKKHLRMWQKGDDRDHNVEELKDICYERIEKARKRRGTEEYYTKPYLQVWVDDEDAKPFVFPVFDENAYPTDNIFVVLKPDSRRKGIWLKSLDELLEVRDLVNEACDKILASEEK